jgi:putative effector of murein hydrolase
MEQQTTVGQKKPFLRKRVLIAMGVSLGITLVCFVVPAFLPAPQESLLKDPIHSFLIGAGVAGIAYPLWATGQAIKRRWESSPYFEGAFIAAVLNLFALVCFGVALACIGFGVYDLIVRVFDLE